MVEDLPLPVSDANVDDIYLRVWEKQQHWTSTRWGIMTFFLSVSFAIFGLSFNKPPSLSVDATAQRITGMAIYWFSFLICRRYDDWSKFLRDYLYELELTTATRFKLQTTWRNSMRKGIRRWTTVNKLMIYFGVLYSVSIIALYYWGL